MSQETVMQDAREARQTVGSDLDRLYKLSIVVLAALAVLLVTLYVGRFFGIPFRIWTED